MKTGNLYFNLAQLSTGELSADRISGLIKIRTTRPAGLARLLVSLGQVIFLN